MKKLLALIFALILLAGCSGQNHSSEATGASDAPAPSASASASETTVPVTPTTEYTTAPTADTQAESSETKPHSPASFWKEEKQENGEEIKYKKSFMKACIWDYMNRPYGLW